MSSTKYRFDLVGERKYVCVFFFSILARIVKCVFLLIAAVIYMTTAAEMGRVYNVSLTLHTHTHTHTVLYYLKRYACIILKSIYVVLSPFEST